MIEYFLRFISKYKAFFIFLLLEAISLTMIVKSSVFQKSVVIQNSMQTIYFFHKKIDDITSYFSLRQSNDYLSKQNAELQSTVLALKETIDEYGREVPAGELDTDRDLSIVAAKVIYKNMGGVDNYFVINKGSEDGVLKGSGVVAENSVVGVIQFLSKNYSVVLLPINSKLMLSGKFKKSNYLCSVVWDGQTLFSGKINNIPKHLNIASGDSVVTSGFSSIFPENMLIGTIKKSHLNKVTASFNFDINFTANFITTKYVSVVINKHSSEIEEINRQIEK